MNIYIDESGSFVSAREPGSWNAVAAFALPEAARKGLEKTLSHLKRRKAVPESQEVKINQLDDIEYFALIQQLAHLNGSLFCIATDAGLNTPESVVEHQRLQITKITEHLGKMRFESGRLALESLASQVEKLSPQLYIQLFCQVQLMYDVVSRAITYYAQHNPASLARFRWRVDRKNTIKTNYEDAFEKLSPPILQSMSLAQPMIMIEGLDYSKLSRYEYEPENFPTYLKDDYGIGGIDDGLNIQKIIREDIKFIDSKESPGIQVVDLLVSGIRKCLRRKFKNNEIAAALLGKLMAQWINREPPLRFLSFGFEGELDQRAAHLVNIMRRHAKPILRGTL